MISEQYVKKVAGMMGESAEDETVGVGKTNNKLNNVRTIIKRYKLKKPTFIDPVQNKTAYRVLVRSGRSSMFDELPVFINGDESTHFTSENVQKTLAKLVEKINKETGIKVQFRKRGGYGVPGGIDMIIPAYTGDDLATTW